jgi:3-hydroxyacyl-CoA dehydrogenase
MRLKYLDKPVVAAPAGMALGGGCEICLASDRVRFAAETYMGLVEVGVGLLPAGGGARRCSSATPSTSSKFSREASTRSRSS